MPIVAKKNTEVGILGIWKLSESSTELMSKFNFSEKENEEFRRNKAEKRKTEYLATRLLLQDLLNEKTEIQYYKTGKPFLENTNKNLSISHSSDFVVVLLSENKIGVDVENTERNMDKIALRFLHEKEFKHIQNLEYPKTATVLYWSAKEAIFKCTNEQNILFNEQITILPFEIKKEGHFFGTFTFNSSIINYKLWYFFYEKNVTVYCIEKENKKS